MKKLIYLANAYSATGELHNTDKGRLISMQRRCLEAYAAGQLRKRYGVAIIAPIALSAAMADICDFSTGFDEWAEDDLLLISKCDEVWVLMSDGWDESYGVMAEIEYAIKRHTPIMFVDPDTFELFN